jgi:hypothetical protein
MRRYAELKNTFLEKDMDLLPIMNPLFNMREICKQMVLLEDHLNNIRKRCHDCIRKHFLTIEAFFEEAISLDKDLKYLDILEGQAQNIRNLQGIWLKIKDDPELGRKAYYRISQKLREVRKELTPYCFDVVDMDKSQFNKKFACSLATCPHRVAKLYIATKTMAQKEDEDVSKMVKPLPKKKPPRKDLEKTRMSVNDNDLEDLSGDGDRDLSLHNTKVGYFFR